MRVILDECLPRPLGREFHPHDVTTVQRQGWAGVTNGELLRRISLSGIEAFLTVDKNLHNQQRVSTLPFGIVALRARSNNLRDLLPLTPRILEALAGLKPGHVLFAPDDR